MVGGSQPSATGVPPETEEVSPALAARLLANATFAPGSVQEGDRGGDDEFLKLSTPGDTVPAAALQQALADWKKVKGRASGGKSDWKPLGPSDAQGLHVEFRDRTVYTAGTPNFSGRIVHGVIDPNCRATAVHALDRERERRRLADEQRLDAEPEVGVRLAAGSSRTTCRRSSSTRTTSRAERSGPARASRTPAAAAARPASASTSRRTAATRWTGPFGRDELLRPRRRLDRGQARRLEDDLRGVGPRDPRHLEHLLRRHRRAHPGRPALRALALARRRQSRGQLVNQGATALCTRQHAGRGLAQPDGRARRAAPGA